MGYNLTVQGLLRKRAELASQVEAKQTELRSIIAAVQGIDAAIQVFKPEFHPDDLPQGFPPAPFTAFRGEIQRFLLEELRGANAPLSTFDLAERVLVFRGLDPKDGIAVSLMRKRTGYALVKLRKAGKVTSRRSHNSAPLEWRLA
jgi:hypothetical protein